MNIKKAAAFAIGPIGAAALGFITLPIITWFYSAEDIGRIAMLQLASGFCVLFFSLGLDQAYVRDYHESENKPALLKISLLPGLCLLVVSLVPSFISPGFISRTLFSVDSVLISILVALSLLATLTSRFLSLVLRMQERGLAFSMSQVLPKVLFLCVVGVYCFLSFGFDLSHLVLAQVISLITVTLVFSWNVRQELSASIKSGIDIEKLISMLRFGAPLIIGGVAFWGLTAMDKIFLRNLSTFEELGLYSVASSFAAAAAIFQNIFSTIWMPTVYRWVAEGVDTGKKIDQTTDYVLTAVVILFSVAGLLSWTVTYLLPPSYERVEYILVACMAYPLLYILSEVTGAGLGIARKSAHVMGASIFSAVVNLIINYLLTPKYGAAGAAVSTAISFWVFFFCRTELSCRLWRPTPRLFLYGISLACLTLSIAFALVGHNYNFEFISFWLALLMIGGWRSRTIIRKIFTKAFKQEDKN
ncbi:oligosaccharide flippase family protein [Pseudomonas sp. LA21]|uniref:lipopolysaccharide biosynthesis protein n=1 Tax=unclassified Pseudomonas TaxID=196821 RepID=UPI001FB78829|nr:oligosaccharide flippase family protein [Pseudomonas sp. LA21]MCJ1883437.1 oligosaccharide flippase family protein [Pseudomonas sp. LA21]